METVEAAASRGTDRVIVAALALSMLLASLGTSIANIALPALAEAFTAPFHQVQWVVTGYLAALTVSVVVGRLGDVHGLRRMHLAGLGLFCGASLLCGLATDIWQLVGARVLQGAGAAFAMTLSMALMRASVREERLGRAMGLLGTVSALGTALGPSLGGVLVATVGWRGVFLAPLPLAILALIAAFMALPRDERAHAGKEGASRSGIRTMFIPRLAASLLVNLLVAAVMMTTLVVGPFYLGIRLGLTEALVGLVMSVGPAISILSGLPAGQAVDAWGTRRVLGIGLVMLTAGSFLLALLPNALGLAGYVLAIIVLTPGYQLFQAANNTAVLADVAKEARGSVSGLLGLSRNLGLMAGASVISTVFAVSAGIGDSGHGSASAIAEGMRTTFLLVGGMMAFSLWLAFVCPAPAKRS
ncbi:MFS transporter [Nitratireductor pacificus]|uniref:Major facilitator superfamily transporter n=1 Tax=Nitratireductor pacificus pht-3B TaxID=391937 RepID=K2MCI9_9HYPH|nr:MFS transporter [Nitratireductor pacificus]EKF19886.1 major facilitator superfamily transporter [Nitratireductor pacificus pht-3B]